jgi:hypothetical protein
LRSFWTFKIASGIWRLDGGRSDDELPSKLARRSRYSLKAEVVILSYKMRRELVCLHDTPYLLKDFCFAEEPRKIAERVQPISPHRQSSWTSCHRMTPLSIRCLEIPIGLFNYLEYELKTGIPSEVLDRLTIWCRCHLHPPGPRSWADQRRQKSTKLPSRQKAMAQLWKRPDAFQFVPNCSKLFKIVPYHGIGLVVRVQAAVGGDRVVGGRQRLLQFASIRFN